MITESAIYWITRLDAIHRLLCLPIAICLVGLFVITLCQFILRYPSSGSPAKDTADRLLFRGAPLCVVALLLCATGKTFIPTTKEMCAIRVIPAIVDNEKTRAIGGEIYNVALEWLNELRPAKTE